jgi:antitoxin component YwqK of YwqJK toxin-antitoxin module
MRLLILFSLLFITFSCSKKGKEFKRKDINNRIVEGYFINDTIYDGVIKYYTYTGYLEGKATFQNGIKNGFAINYYPNGNIWDSSFYMHGLRNGYHYVFDSFKNLTYRDFYFYGHRLGEQIIYKNGKISKYVFSNFEKQQLYEGLYDSSEILFRYGGEIINASLYKATKDAIPSFGVFSYFLNPPHVNIKYSLGVIEEKTEYRKELIIFNNGRVFTDTILAEPTPGWNYYINADYNDTLSKYKKTFLTVLKW